MNLIVFIENCTVAGYNITASQFDSMFTDGYIFNYLIHKREPELVDISSLPSMTPIQRLTQVSIVPNKMV
jgi:hypothetical protein